MLNQAHAAGEKEYVEFAEPLHVRGRRGDLAAERGGRHARRA